MTKKTSTKTLILQEYIEQKILLIRERQVMLDRDLAKLYNVTTGNLNKAVKRNIDRFPEDFMFPLTKKEAESLRFQSGSLKRGSNIKYLPHVFTQEGVAMLSSVLNGKRAILVNIQIMRVFVKLRKLILSHKDLSQKIDTLEHKFEKHDKNFTIIFEAIKRLINPPLEPKEPIGFHANKNIPEIKKNKEKKPC